MGVTGILVETIKLHFNGLSEGLKVTKILPHEQWEPENSSNYPAIFVKRDVYQVMEENQVIGDVHSTMMPEKPADIRFWLPIRADYSLIVVGKSYGHTEQLANELFCYLTKFKFFICSCLQFDSFKVRGVNPVEILQEARDFRTCSIPISTSFQMIWDITTELPVLQNVNLEVKG